MSNRYALLDSEGLVVNVIAWDGLAPWSPADGETAVEAPDWVSVDWRSIDGVWTAPEEA
ncbi:MAG TPA: hypothetical protein VF138_07475 [Caulobacteraceae bacterium]